MAPTTNIKEEFYVRRLFNNDVPVFVDATRHVKQDLPYPLSAKKSLKATCGVRTDDEVVAFSLRSYTSRQAEREVENVETQVGGKVVSQNILHLRMPRKTLHGLNETARELSAVLGDEVIVEFGETLYVLQLSRTGGEGELKLVGRLDRSDAGYVRSKIDEADVEFELPISGVRLRLFMRSPIRERILAYSFGGYLTRKPGEIETITRATALTLNNVLGLSTFRMLSGLESVDVPALSPEAGHRRRQPSARIAFDVPVMLFAQDNTPAARGHIAAEIDLDGVDPVTGGLQIVVSENDRLEWNPALAGQTGFQAYEQVLAETIASVVHSVLGADKVRDIAYDIMLSELKPEAVAEIQAATGDFPGLAANPAQAEVRPTQPAPGVPVA
ncbi:hypothetical protein AB0L00_26040 [Actinoallomurus sp. NPDC052308]|uniref:hypothetical protein n=1 Tax=Actinoallomurus sp. NPDC052308 TaxID=3155530 RepID=UPI0034443163